MYKLFEAYHNININNLTISKEKKVLLENIIKTNDEYNFIRFMTHYHRELPTLYDLDPYNEIFNNDLGLLLYDNIFIAPNAQLYAETHNIREYKHREKYNGSNIDITIYSMPENKHLLHINKVITICQYMLDKFNKNSDIKLIFLLTPYKKRILDDTENLLPIHINSGCTVKGTNKLIYIWRYEEWKKVLIHELIHYLDLDIPNKQQNTNALATYVLDNYNIDGYPLPNEAYTDTLAILIHSELFNLDINKEINFSCFQASKLLKLFKHKNMQDLFDKKYVIKQKTSAFSYYVLKSILLFNKDKFCDLIKNFTINKFIDLLKLIKNKKYVDKVNNYIKLLDNDIESYLKYTMKMSFY